LPGHLSDPIDESARPARGPGDSPGRPADRPDESSPAGVARTESERTLGTVVEMVRRVMRANAAGVAAFSPDGRRIDWKAASGFGANDAGDGFAAPLGADLAERAARADGLLIFADAVGAGESSSGAGTLALAPLRARGETLGALVVGFRRPHAFAEEERHTLEGLAEVAALALDNARLLETVIAGKKIWEQTFDAIPDGVIVHDAEMRVRRANAVAAEMMGLDSPAQAIGLTSADAFARLFGERAAAFHMSRRAGDAASSFEIQAEDGRRYLVAVAPLTASLESAVWGLESENGSQKPEAVSPELTGGRAADSRPTTPGSGASSWSVITWSDVTQLSEMQEQLSRSRRLATVGQLAAGVAHEINNPLAAVTTCAEATLRDLRSDPALASTAAERGWDFYLEEIVRQALRCKAITRGLLDLARQRRAGRDPCDLNALVESTVRLFEQRAAAGGESVEFAVELDEEIGEVATDEGLTRQVLDNLLTNALDALAGAGSITVSTSAQGARVCVEVRDTGPGIPPELMVRIFDPFFTTKEAGKGSGLGLAIATTLAEALGGALTVESKAGAGSRFRLWLPLRAPEGRHGG
jgi:signal transduction histidine kinase